MRRPLIASGNITVLDVLDREQALTEARTILAGSRRDVALAHIALLSALGLGDEVRTNGKRRAAPTLTA